MHPNIPFASLSIVLLTVSVGPFDLLEDPSRPTSIGEAVIGFHAGAMPDLDPVTKRTWTTPHVVFPLP